MSKNLKIIPLLLLILLFLVGCGQADSVQGRQFEDAELKEDSNLRLTFPCRITYCWL